MGRKERGGEKYRIKAGRSIRRKPQTPGLIAHTTRKRGNKTV